MNITKITIGQIFGKLQILSRAENINNPNSARKTTHQWNCLCQCGRQIKVLGPYLLRGRARSCGCQRDATPRSNLRCGDRFERLVLVSYCKGKWTARCDCGNQISRPTNQITSGNIKSCGCLNIDQNYKKIDKMMAVRRKYDPVTASARRVWKRYLYHDKECNLSFPEWLSLSQGNCHYCGIGPSTHFNYFKVKSSRGSQTASKNGEFVYNGLDRLDSGRAHTIDNVVTCCSLCNRNKSDLSVEDFLAKINTLKVRKFTPLKLEKLQIDNNYLATSIRSIFYNYKKDSDLELEEFYYLSQLDCYYCGKSKTNNFSYCRSCNRSSLEAKEKSVVTYNGIDRVDSDKGHTKDNVVPCCRECNFGKSKMSLRDFNLWIRRIKQYQSSKKK
jgi:hypothetical protein